MRMLPKAVVATTLLLVAGTAFAEFPATVTAVKSEKGKTVSIKGDLKTGAPMEDLDWAASSSNACFPATQNEKFRGNHVMYSTELPPKSIMFVTVVPDDPKADMSIWGYSVGTNNFSVPPKLASCVSCEAEHKWDRPKKGQTQDHKRKIRFNAIGNPYNVVIGVAGPKGVVTGGYTLEIELQ